MFISTKLERLEIIKRIPYYKHITTLTSSRRLETHNTQYQQASANQKKKTIILQHLLAPTVRPRKIVPGQKITRRSELTFHTFPYKTWPRTVYTRKKSMVRLEGYRGNPFLMVGSPSKPGLLFSVNTLARPAGSTQSRREKQSIRECCWLGQGTGINFFV